jgi:hypothetical protein
MNSSRSRSRSSARHDMFSHRADYDVDDLETLSVCIWVAIQRNNKSSFAKKANAALIKLLQKTNYLIIINGGRVNVHYKDVIAETS